MGLKAPNVLQTQDLLDLEWEGWVIMSGLATPPPPREGLLYKFCNAIINGANDRVILMNEMLMFNKLPIPAHN